MDIPENHCLILELILPANIWMELLAWPGLSPIGEVRVKEFLSALAVPPLSDNVEMLAISLQRTTKIKLPDAIVAAAIVHTDSTLITHDQHLDDLNWPNL